MPLCPSNRLILCSSFWFPAPFQLKKFETSSNCCVRRKMTLFFVLFPSSSINIYVHYQIYGCDGVNINAWCNKMIRSWLVLLSCFFYLKFFIWNMWNYIREIDFFARANKRCQIDEMEIIFGWSSILYDRSCSAKTALSINDIGDHGQYLVEVYEKFKSCLKKFN